MGACADFLFSSGLLFGRMSASASSIAQGWVVGRRSGSGECASRPLIMHIQMRQPAPDSSFSPFSTPFLFLVRPLQVRGLYNSSLACLPAGEKALIAWGISAFSTFKESPPRSHASRANSTLKGQGGDLPCCTVLILLCSPEKRREKKATNPHRNNPPVSFFPPLLCRRSLK